MKTVPYSPGDGETYQIDIKIIYDFPRDEDGFCAFCHGDPCNKSEIPTITNIYRYYLNSPEAVTCPMCKGKSS